MAEFNKCGCNAKCLILIDDYIDSIDSQEQELLDELDSLVGVLPKEGGSTEARRVAEHDIKAEEEEELRPAREAQRSVEAAEYAVMMAKRSCRADESANRKANKLMERRLRKLEQICQKDGLHLRSGPRLAYQIMHCTEGS